MTDTETEVNQGGSSPFYSSSRWAYDVFLNFRGADTRGGFTTVLNNALTDRGIRTFFDDDKLRRGQRISLSLLAAIEESRFAIVVFSPNYATSSYCLDELVHIMSCCKGDEDRLVLPVFYDVDPSQVRHQGGAYGEALAKHRRVHGVEEEKIRKWREALYDAANLSGWHVQQGSKSEYMFIRKIIGEISRKINRTFLQIGNHLVGMESRARKFIKMLRLDSDEGVFMVGIWGMGGVGKSTLARAVFNLISGQFEATCFLADVGRRSHEHGIVKLQEALLSEIVEEKDIRFEKVGEIIPILRHRLHRKKVLLILDGVSQQEQLKSLAGGTDWFGPGSRIIISTRAQGFVLNHGVYAEYLVHSLNHEEALELFCWKAFEDNKPDPVYMEISDHVVSYSRGHPLALEIIGSYLFGKQIGEWRFLLDKYEQTNVLDRFLDVLFGSYDGLDADVKTIFLDIACCFNGYELEYIKDLLLNGRGIRTDYGIQVPISKSFIKIDGGRVRMHDLVQALGRDTVWKESPRDPGKRSRLWLHDDILGVLQNNKGTASIEIMKIDLPKGVEVQWDGKAFKNMKNLKILEIVDSRFSCVPTHLPKSLRVLNCKGYFSSAN